MCSYPLVIPAAGLGSRLFPTSWAVPKELFPIDGKPALHHLLDEALVAEIKNILCITSARKNALTTYLGYQSEVDDTPLNADEKVRLQVLDQLNKSFTYSFAFQEVALGVGNALLSVKNVLKNPYFCMAYPDDILADCTGGLSALINIHKKFNGMVIAVEKVPYERIHSYGVISYSEKLTDSVFKIDKIVEKPSAELAPSQFGIVGRYVLSQGVLSHLDNQQTEKPCFISALNDLIQEGVPTFAYVLQTERYDIGTIAGWVNAVKKFDERRNELLVSTVEKGNLHIFSGT